jgi:hypothetical protein
MGGMRTSILLLAACLAAPHLAARVVSLEIAERRAALDSRELRPRRPL